MKERPDIALRVGTIADKPIFHHLMQLYLYDFSEHDGRDPDPHGIFNYHYLDHYWTADGQIEGRVPFLVIVDTQLAGFVLKRRQSYLGMSDTEHSIAEFFVMRKWRRFGIGRTVACELFDRFPGRWEIAQERTNAAAQTFWRSIIGEYTRGQYEEVMLRPPAWDGPVQSFVVHARTTR